MRKVSKVTAAFMTAAGVVVLAGAAFGQVSGSVLGPAQSDFDACNREAQVLRGGNPSAGGSASPGSTPSSAAGATGATGSVSGGSTLSGGSSSITGDTSLRGISPSAQADPALPQTYRDCLKRRGF